MRKHFVAILVAALFFHNLSLQAQTNIKDSAVSLLKGLEKAHKGGKMSDRIYLDTVHSTMLSLLSVDVNFTNKELLAVLEPYRQTAWSSHQFDEDKRTYYSLLSNQAQFTGRAGEMLYYADKFNEVEKANSGRASVTALTIQSDYYNTNNSFDLSQALYKNNEVFVLGLPAEARKETTTMPQAVQSVVLLVKLGEGLYGAGDTINGNKVLQAAREATETVESRFPDVNRAVAHSQYAYYTLIYYKADAIGSAPLALESFALMEKQLQSDKTPDYLKNFISFFLTEKKLAFFIREKNTDSTAVYLKAFDEEYKKDQLVYNLYITKRLKSLALYNEGRYREASDSMLAAIKLLDSSRTIATREVDEMMYAQAKTEEQDVLLAEAKAAAQRRENTIRLIVAGALLLVTAGLLFIWRQRQRQRKKLIEFKLNMARNIHDETGPALLYAKSLAKNYRTKGYSEELTEEVEKQLDNTIAVIRGLSHDLKSTELHSVFQLIKELDGVLKKLKGVNVFTYSIDKQLKEDRFISHYQYSHLKSILHECITNSVKHSQFDKIQMSFRQENNRLQITYKDNGKGWEQGDEAKGIGLENIAERVKQMNGEYLVTNNFPEGYAIDIKVLLR
ncbi:sensor histidine kinase [Terrimonas ferruginea]|uniref:sensor histidine kinase n=1 Tax=Terrimonas ferruginea TaxID=249 RepID=UPI00040FADC7|nr:ATP-binding protein [Terrimonas ferruginea]